MMPPRYPYVAIDIDERQAEDAASLLFELGAAGIEWRDATTLQRAATGTVTLVASFELEADARLAAAGLPSVWSPRVEEVVGDAWRDEWKKYFEPFQIARGVVLCPPWRQYKAKPGETIIVLEPGRAFGTGLHETTRLIAEVLVDSAAEFEGLSGLDVGCGSGVLSLVALACGARHVRAIDVDPAAVLVTRENAARNRMCERLEVDDAALDTVTGRFAAVTANIDAKTLVELAPVLVERVDRGGLLVVGGILSPEAAPKQLDEVRRACSALNEEAVRRKGDWIALILRG